jgi:hypothetical protein
MLVRPGALLFVGCSGIERLWILACDMAAHC